MTRCSNFDNSSQTIPQRALTKAAIYVPWAAMRASNRVSTLLRQARRIAKNTPAPNSKTRRNSRSYRRTGTRYTALALRPADQNNRNKRKKNKKMSTEKLDTEGGSLSGNLFSSMSPGSFRKANAFQYEGGLYNITRTLIDRPRRTGSTQWVHVTGVTLQGFLEHTAIGPAHERPTCSSAANQTTPTRRTHYSPPTHEETKNTWRSIRVV